MSVRASPGGCAVAWGPLAAVGLASVTGYAFGHRGKYGAGIDVLTDTAGAVAAGLASLVLLRPPPDPGPTPGGGR